MSVMENLRARETPLLDGSFWLWQNKHKNSEWGALARAGHKVAHLMRPHFQGYAGQIRVDGISMDYNTAREKYAGIIARQQATEKSREITV